MSNKRKLNEIHNIENIKNIENIQISKQNKIFHEFTNFLQQNDNSSLKFQLVNYKIEDVINDLIANYQNNKQSIFYIVQPHCFKREIIKFGRSLEGRYLTRLRQYLYHYGKFDERNACMGCSVKYILFGRLNVISNLEKAVEDYLKNNNKIIHGAEWTSASPEEIMKYVQEYITTKNYLLLYSKLKEYKL